MMKKLLLIALILFVAQLQGQVRIDEREAFSTAESFLQENTSLQRPSLALSETIGSRQSGLTNLYVFSIEPRGFVIVSALNDVLAYSLTSPMSKKKVLPSHIAYWLNLYNEATDQLIEHPVKRKAPTKSQTAVDPLLTSCWGQGCYHNEACPSETSGPCHHVEAGCVAIAMAQIMYYHKHPLTGNGETAYTCEPYGILSANFGQTTYQWDEMADTLHESNPAVATLVYHCGLSVRMRYSSNGSGAYSQDVPDAIRQHFSYPAATFAARSSYNDEEWQRIIKNDLDQHHPVYYAGKSGLGGHAFVCDGYDNSGMFHFNFGWDGVADGYYTLASPYGFSSNQSIVHSIFSFNQIPIHSDSHGIIYVSTSGTGDGSSWAQATSELQLAIFKSSIDTSCIWIKEGTYTGQTEEEYAFTTLLNCRLYGGFKGDEPYDYDLTQRDFEAHPSILDGIHTQGVIGEIPYGNDTIVIDGFTIQNGSTEHGGGIMLESNTRIKNCKFYHNYASAAGGAISQSQNSITQTRAILIEDCLFSDNEAYNGGAVADYGNTNYNRCVFQGNRALNNGGGVYCVTNGFNSHFCNCTISNNTARQGGGIAVSVHQGASFWNCLINNNTAVTGGGCFLTRNAGLFNCTIVKNEGTEAYGGVYYDNMADIRNCIVWGNTSPDGNKQIGPLQTFTYCAVQDSYTVTGNNYHTAHENDGDSSAYYIRFKAPVPIAGSTGYGGDWRLKPNSLCIDCGNSMSGQPEFDLDGSPRFQHGNVDLGAYESNTVALFTEAIFCEHVPYYYQDSLIPGTGYYSFLYPNSAYDSLVILHMQNPPVSVYLEEEICENDTFDFFGTPLANAGLYHKTIDCITYELELSTVAYDSVFMQETICKGSTFDFFGSPISEAGSYFATIDCITYQLDLSVNPHQWVNHAMEAEICEGEMYNFYGTLLRQGGHFTKDIGCDTYELDLTVNPRPAIQCSNDTIVEYGNTVTLTASGADSYLWSTGETTESITVFPIADKQYTVTGFSPENKCSISIDVMVKITNKNEDFILYPNPANNSLKIYKSIIDEVEVYNLLGVMMDRVDANREVIDLDVSRYDNGIYIVHVRCLDNHYYKKLIIQH